MIFGKHINRYYLRFAPLILLGLVALVVVDYLGLLQYEQGRNLYEPAIKDLETYHRDGESGKNR